MFKRALSFLGIFFGMAMMASVGDVTPQRLGSINRNTTMYSASQVDELIGTGPSGDPSGSVKTNSSGVIEANIGVNGDFTQTNGVVRFNATGGAGGVYIGTNTLSTVISNYMSGIEVSEITDGTNTIDAAGNVFHVQYLVGDLYYSESRDFDDKGLLQFNDSRYVILSNQTFYMFRDDYGSMESYAMQPMSGHDGWYEDSSSYADFYFKPNFTSTPSSYYTTVITNYVGKLALTNDIPPAITVVAPSTNATAGTAADAKATGTALYTGFTEWVCDNPNYFIKWYEYDGFSGWAPFQKDDPEGSPQGNYIGNADSISLVWEDGAAVVDLSATRHLITPTKTSQLSNDGTNGVPFAQISDLNYEIVFSGGWLVSGSDVQPWHLYSVEQINNEVYWTYILRENGIEISRADIGIRESSVDFSISGDPSVDISAIYRGYALLSRKVNIINVSTSATVAFPSNSVGESTDFYINMMVSDLQPQSVSFVDSNGNPISWVEPPPSTFSYGTNVIHVTEVDENVYSYTMPGVGSELRDVRIIGTLSQGHESASATNLYSTAQGTNTLAIGIASHAEGGRTTAKGTYSHSEGVGTSANGLASHSQGLFTIAAERGSFAAGANAVASNSWSFAWSGIEGTPNYGSHGVSTFNVNPANGIYGFYIGNKTLEENIADAILAPGNITNLIVAYETAQSSNNEGTMPVTNGVARSYTTLRSAVATVVGDTINSPMDQLGGFSLPEYVSTLKKYEYDEVKGSYRKSISNDFIVLTFVTNIDVTAVQNISVLKAIEERFKAAQQNP